MVGIIDIVMILVMICLAWAITSMVLIISKVEKSGTRINFFLINLQIFLRKGRVAQPVSKRERWFLVLFF